MPQSEVGVDAIVLIGVMANEVGIWDLWWLFGRLVATVSCSAMAELPSTLAFGALSTPVEGHFGERLGHCIAHSGGRCWGSKTKAAGNGAKDAHLFTWWRSCSRSGHDVGLAKSREALFLGTITCQSTLRSRRLGKRWQQRGTTAALVRLCFVEAKEEKQQ
jgi:hypothetical protein